MTIPDGAGAPAWEVVDALLDAALDQPASSRIEWVRANAANEQLASEVIALLAASERSGVLDMEIPANLAKPESSEDIAHRLRLSLDGRYRIEGVLGEGGTATVFLAHELKHQRPVVLKVLRPEVARWIGAERFRKEIAILARISHPHIIALIDSGDADGLLYYVMPHVGGETLRDWLERGPLTYDEALPVFRDIASALAQAHAKNLVHRDLKPDNILIVSGHAFLMDFGIAKLKPELGEVASTLEGFAIGTPAYMSPEQAAGRPIDTRADLYSWGIVARETLTGRSDDTPLPRSVPSKMRSLIARCLETDREKRPRTGGDLLAALEVVPDHAQRGVLALFRALSNR